MSDGSEQVDPYRAPQVELTTPRAEREPAELVSAGLERRFVAALIDYSIYAAAVFVGLILGASFVFRTAEQIKALSSGQLGDSALTFRFVAVGALLVATLVQLVVLRSFGATIGKRLMRIRLVRVDGSGAGMGRVFMLRMMPQAFLAIGFMLVPYSAIASDLRSLETMMELGTFAKWVAWIVLLIDALFIYSRDGRCLHDRWADTRVVEAA